MSHLKYDFHKLYCSNGKTLGILVPVISPWFHKQVLIIIVIVKVAHCCCVFFSWWNGRLRAPGSLSPGQDGADGPDGSDAHVERDFVRDGWLRVAERHVSGVR